MNKKLRDLTTVSSFSIQSSTTTKYPEIVDPLCKDEGSEITGLLPSGSVGIGEEWVCSNKTDPQQSCLLKLRYKESKKPKPEIKA